MSFAGTFFIIGAVLMAAANGMTCMIFGRITLGIGVGAGLISKASLELRLLVRCDKQLSWILVTNSEVSKAHAIAYFKFGRDAGRSLLLARDE